MVMTFPWGTRYTSNFSKARIIAKHSFSIVLYDCWCFFNFEDMYNIFKEDSISRGFSMILLVLLILFGTITMVNLFIAVVISDIKQLNEDVFTQNLINMAQCSILVEELMPVWVLNNMMVEDSINICIHSLCPKSCRGKKLPPNMKPLLEALKKISKDCLESARQSSKRSSVQIQTFIEKNNNWQI